MKFDPRRLQFRRELNLLRIRINEEACFDSGGIHRVDHARDLVAMFHDIEAAFCRNFLAAFRHKTHRMGLQLKSEFGHRRRACHLKIEPRRLRSAQSKNILVLDMPAVFPQMHRDSIGPGLFATKSQFNRIGLDIPAESRAGLPVAGLPQGGRMVDIDTEQNHEAINIQKNRAREISKSSPPALSLFQFSPVPPCFAGHAALQAQTGKSVAEPHL